VYIINVIVITTNQLQQNFMSVKSFCTLIFQF